MNIPRCLKSFYRVDIRPYTSGVVRNHYQPLHLHHPRFPQVPINKQQLGGMQGEWPWWGSNPQRSRQHAHFNYLYQVKILTWGAVKSLVNKISFLLDRGLGKYLITYNETKETWKLIDTWKKVVMATYFSHEASYPVGKKNWKLMEDYTICGAKKGRIVYYFKLFHKQF